MAVRVHCFSLHLYLRPDLSHYMYKHLAILPKKRAMRSIENSRMSAFYITYNRNHPERGGFYYVSFLQEMLYKQE